ncbi:hypothetical protein SEVIR_5G021500v4 [Setaria viridis]|uniref:RING-type domain-containing protein n=2 Tax=Setaria TaxID=4554 RepID=K3XMD7_SETIT|nr:RING-H2 finger protein ATL3 [Setaria italica]XP_012701322.1 RING-H2 finger protein ATL3 [Setaria italica]XP_034593317.1 RING-H2 finger protein ATL3-like [Setaria viridis]RCV23634.1 hypothetical protein SETIT_5G022900v2 [Setaria italica]RCV23635.1 hypothetical protein SETIT_5G022900v2 [Setaria italica]TKW12197.1 hypothetical protein SEVIR_5G021500v2 [Setaria viridis]
MSGQSSSPYGETDTGTDTAPTTAGSSIRWAPHGRAMTACLVAVNVALVSLVYLYFWRLFSRKRAASSSSAAADEEDGASSSASVPSSPAMARDEEQQQRRHDRLLASLPPSFVARPGAGAGAECAVCIAELLDGDEARALPRCGHRFHAACVDAWLRRRHTTCPLCRASVVVAAAEDVDAPV